MADDITPIPPDDAPPDPAEAELVAYLDGELDATAARRVEAKLAGDPTLRARATALKKTFALLDFLPKPEPSPTFATRTLDKIPAVKSASVPVPAVAVTMSQPLPAPVTRARAWAAGVLVAGLFALAGGYVVTSVARPYLFPATRQPDSDAIPLADLRVIERLRVYAVADDIEFVAKLTDPEYFGDDPAVLFDGPPPPAATDPGDKPTGAELDRLVKAFQALPPERQAAVRRLDQQLHEKPPPARDRLFRVLEAYAAWLDRLPDAERKGVLAAVTPGLRLEAVRLIRKHQWLDAQPLAQKKQLDALPADKRAAEIGKWREEEAANRAMWSFARRHWDANRTDRVPWPFDDEGRKKEVLEFVRHTFKTDGPRCRLVPGELEKLRVAQEDGAWLWFGKIVYDAAKNHEMLPEPATGKPLTDFADLWPRAKEHYEKTPGKKRSVAVAAGKWPEFALAVHSDLVPAKFGPVSVSSYGPCRPADFKDPLRLFVADLEKKVRPAEWAELKAHEGRWPDYPRALVKLATQHDLSVPGVTPPGAPSLWEKNYNPKPAPPKGAE